MKKISLSALAVLASTAMATASTVTLDFEDGTSGDNVNSFYAAQGAVFS